MFVERPQMRGEVRIETEESLAACHAEGLLYEIEVDARGPASWRRGI